jgi:hypothetical protein
MERTCTCCGKTGEIDFFSPSQFNRPSAPQCRECVSARHKTYRISNKEKINARRRERRRLDGNTVRYLERLQRYKLTEPEFLTMLVLQDSQCAICDGDLRLSLHVDHDHQTGNVRGLLCEMCNQGLGNFKDNIQNLDRAKNYLGETTYARLA